MRTNPFPALVPDGGALMKTWPRLTVIRGVPGVGKSTLAATIAANVSAGRPTAGLADARPPANVLLVSPWDHESLTRARLDAACADVSRVWLWRTAEGPHVELPGDLGRVEAAVRAVSVSVLVLDPLLCDELRASARGLEALSARTGVAVVVTCLAWKRQRLSVRPLWLDLKLETDPADPRRRCLSDAQYGGRAAFLLESSATNPDVPVMSPPPLSPAAMSFIAVLDDILADHRTPKT